VIQCIRVRRKNKRAPMIRDESTGIHMSILNHKDKVDGQLVSVEMNSAAVPSNIKIGAEAGSGEQTPVGSGV
jgi:hypothetical protein